MKKIIIAIILSAGYFTSYAQSISANEKMQVISKIKELLTEHFVSTDKAKIIVDSLNASQFKATSSRSEFVKRLNKKLHQ